MAVDTKLTDLGTATTFSAGSWFLLVDPAVTTMDDSGTDLKVQAGNLINGLLPSQTGNSGKVLSTDGAGVLSWAVQTGGGGGSGTVTTVSVASANGFGGSVANATTTPAITITTSITGILKGNGTAISAAASGTDYEPPITAGSTSQYLKGDKSLGTLNQAAVAGLTTASSPAFAGLTVGTLAGLLKGTTGSVGVATAGTDYLTPSGSGASLTGITATQVGAEPTITAGTTAQYLRGDKSLGTLNQAAVAGLTTASSPTFAGLTVGALSGLLKAASGTISAATAGTDYLTTSYAGTSSIVTVGTITSGTWTGTTIAIANGGTGQTTAANAINALLPSQTGKSGQFLSTNGTVAAWGSPSGAGTVTSVSVATANGLAGTVATATSTPAITLSTTVTGIVKGDGTSLSAATLGTDYSRLLAPTAVKTANYTAAAWDFVPCDSTSGGFTVTLPSAPADRTLIEVKHTNQGSTNAITVACGGSDVFNRTAGPTTTSLSSLGRSVQCQYQSSTGIWFVINRDIGGIVAADIPSLPASQITSGQLAVAQGGTNIDASTAANGKLLIGNGTGYTLANLVAGTGIGITNSAGGIAIAQTPFLWQAVSLLTSVSNSTAQTSLMSGGTQLGSLTIPANSLVQGQVFRWAFSGVMSSASGQNITISIYLGSTQIFSSAALAQGSATGVGWSIESGKTGLIVQATGASGKVYGITQFNPYAGGTAQNMVSGSTSGTAAPSQVTVDTTASQVFDLRAQWGAANASNGIQLLGGWIRLEGP